jgi:hypothetical protein
MGSGPVILKDDSLPYVDSGVLTCVSLRPGVANPKDLSHFTIDYFDCSPHPTFHGTFDIHLKDDDTLSVKATEAR